MDTSEPSPREGTKDRLAVDEDLRLARSTLARILETARADEDHGLSTEVVEEVSVALDELEAAQEELEVQRRAAADGRREADDEDQFRLIRDELEARVLERTAQLEAANAWKDELLRRAQAATSEAETSRAELAFLVQASEVLASSLDHETTLANVAALAVPAMADWCLVDLVQPDGTLRQTAVAHVDPDKVALVRELRDRYPPDEEHSIWRVIHSGQPEVASDVWDIDLADRSRDAGHLALLRTVGIRSHVVAPLSARGQVLGAISLVFGTSGRHYGERSVDLAVELARRCAVALDNARLHTQAADAVLAHRAAQQRLDFLLRASTVLNDSLDDRATLQGLGRLAVESVADLCLIDVLHENGAIQRMVAVHADPARQDLARQLEGRYAPDPGGSHPAVQVMRTGRSVLSEEMTDDFLRRTTRDDEHYRITKALGMTSFMCVPLTYRARILGTITLVSTTEGRRFTQADLALAKDLADRAALAVHNARQYRDRDDVARTLQQSLLPPLIPDIPGVEVAVRYLAAGEGNEVGGDFYDVFPLRDGSWGVVIGDVRGKGAGAAAVMGLVRHTVRAAAMQVRRPSWVLSIVNEAMRQQTTEERFATVAYGRLRSASGSVRMTFSSGGHPFPLLVRPDGEIQAVGAPGMLLGLFADPRLADRSMDLAPGDVVVLYTDGVVEARGRKGFFGDGRLAASLAAGAGSDAETIADRVVADVVAFGEGHPRDDLALVVLRIPPNSAA